MGVQLPSEPITRKEQYLAKAAGQAVEIPAEPITREEAYLDAIAKGSGGGGGGTSDYPQLTNKPQINGNTLIGNKSASDLSLASTADLAGKVDKVEGKGLSTNDYTDAEKAIVGGVTSALQGKVDKVEGYGLSENNYTNADKSIVGGVTTALTGKVDKVEGKGLSENDYTDSDKAIVNGVTAAIALKQDKTDNSLDTEAKTIVGAINEHESDIDTLKSGLTDLSEEVNGDATTYPYADVITIEDAVPANVADCNVKIEPVQDLHGYDKPWVGGAGHNMADPSKLYLFTNNTYVGTENFASEGAYDVEPNTEYSFFAATAGSDKKVYFWDSEGNQITPTANTNVFTTPANCAKISFYRNIGAVQTVDEAKVMLCLSQYTTYEPYENICPISGHTEASVQRDGKNLCSRVVDGYIDSLNNALKIDNDSETALFYAKEGVTYTRSFSSETTSARRYTLAKVSDDNLVNNKPVTDIQTSGDTWTATWTGYTLWYLYASGSTEVKESAQIEVGNVATPYEPYSGKTYTIALGDTIYGGTVDFDTGVMTVDRASVDLGSLSWTKYQTVYYTEVSDSVVGTEGELPNIKCSCYKTVTTVTGQTQMLNKDDASITNNASYNRLYVKDTTNYADATEFKTAMDGMTATYELATPTTIQLTPQQIQLLKGQNTLTASTGDISVTVNGVSGSIGSVQEQVNATDEALAELAEKLPDAPTTDGAYVLTVTVADGTPTYSWESAT